jgi:hypothetical protein
VYNVYCTQYSKLLLKLESYSYWTNVTQMTELYNVSTTVVYVQLTIPSTVCLLILDVPFLMVNVICNDEQAHRSYRVQHIDESN